MRRFAGTRGDLAIVAGGHTDGCRMDSPTARMRWGVWARGKFGRWHSQKCEGVGGEEVGERPHGDSMGRLEMRLQP